MQPTIFSVPLGDVRGEGFFSFRGLRGLLAESLRRGDDEGDVDGDTTSSSVALPGTFKVGTFEKSFRIDQNIQKRKQQPCRTNQFEQIVKLK
jgi:hypothetical protein